MEQRKKILALTYCISPYRGSEYNVAWEWVTHMSKDNDLTVLYGTSDEHMGNNTTLTQWLQENELPHVRFVYVKPSKLANLLNWPNRHNIFVYTFYLAYREWHKCAYRIAKKLVKDEKFDLVHMVGPIGYREPGYLWKLGLPYVWGPIGGANNSPAGLMKHLPIKGKIKHSFRSFANTLQLHCNRRIHKALMHTDILLTATSENQRKFKNIHGKDSICLPENSISTDLSLDKDKFENLNILQLVFVGRIDPGKNLIILLEAMAQMEYKGKIHLNVVGSGPEIPACKQYAQVHGIDNLITWHNQLPREQVLKMYRFAHLHIITSISEANTTVIWEAMANGVPTLSFDHCGMHDTLRDGAGILLPISSQYERNVKNLAEALDRFAATPDMPRSLALKTLERAKEYTWDARVKILNDIYSKVVATEN